MSLSTRQALLTILAVFVGLTPFAKAYGGVQWTIPVVVALGLFIALCWKRFPKWQRVSNLKNVASKKAFAEIIAEFGKRAVSTWILLSFLVLILAMTVIAIGIVFSYVLVTVVGIGFYLLGYVGAFHSSLISKRLARRTEELYKASLQFPPNGPSSP